jgi:hypothetical protein
MSRRPLFPPIFAPTVSRPLVDDFALRAQRQRARQQPPGIGSVFELPTRNSPLWDGNNELGKEVGFAADANNRQMVLKLEPWGEPRVWTTLLGITYTPINLPGAGFYNIIAQVVAGVGGAVQEFEVDWLEGTSFSCTMNALTITAAYEQIGGTSLEVPPDLRLRATVGRQPLSTASPPTRSFITPSIPAGSFTSLAIPIPKFARRLTPVSSFGLSDPYASTIAYLWQSNPSAPSTIGGFSGSEFLNGFGANGIPIPIAARGLVVSNTGAIANRVGLAFHLAL